MFGEGEIDKESGLYTPPPVPTSLVSVVMADDGDERAGYALVEFSPGRVAAAVAPTWTALSQFKLEVKGAERCYANGWQQIAVQISVAAQDVGDIPLEISDADLASLKLYAEGNDNALPFLGVNERGIPVGPDGQTLVPWAVSVRLNEIDPYGSGSIQAIAQPAEGKVRTRVFYIHARVAQTITVSASLQNSESLQVVYSRERTDGKVDVTGVPALTFTRDQYSFERERISTNVSPIDGDEFVYLDETIDYYRLPFVSNGQALLKFVELKIPEDINRSTVKWASQQFEDHYCSYTGFSLKPFKGTSPSQERLLFDGMLYRMARAGKHTLPGLAPGKGPAEGGLIISLNRTADLKFWDDVQTGEPYRASLERPLMLELIDQHGNQHKLRVEFHLDERDREAGLTLRDKIALALR